MDNIIIVRYAEIFLKGLNKPFFEKYLVKNIEKAISGVQGYSVKRYDSRIIIEGIEDKDLQKTMDALKSVFGIHSFSPAVRIEADLAKASEVLAGMVKEERKKFVGDMVRFRVEAKRADKNFPMKSNDIAAEAGGVILDNVEGLKVDLMNPEITAYIEIRDKAYCYTSVISGPGGMPVGCGGRAMLMLSGGIDSPVAGLMIAKRGVALSAVHFESFPYTSDKALEKVIDLAKLMTKYTGQIKLHIVRFTEIQMKLHSDCPQDYLTILMRRFMMRIAEKLALQDKCLVTATGESIGQVASQTLESISATNAVATLPVIRPLIGMDKDEIIERARMYGTFNTSILPYEDCCTVFVPKHPATKPVLSNLEKAESILDIEAMVEAAVAGDRVIIVE